MFLTRLIQSNRWGLLYPVSAMVSLLFILIYPILPKRHLLILPSGIQTINSNDDSDVGGKSTTKWLSDDYSHWHCNLQPGADYPYCSIDITFSKDPDDWTRGLNFSSFEKLIVDLEYTGPAKVFRVYIRNFDENISNPTDFNSAKYNRVNIRTKDLDQEIQIKLQEFQLPDWWIDQFDVPRKWVNSSFDRVTSIGLDVSYNSHFGDHELKIKRVELEGNYISSSSWYLSILIFWIVVIILYGLWRIRTLYQRQQLDTLRLNEMAQYAKSMKAQAEDFEYKSQVDNLTGTYNRLGLQSILETTLEWRRKDDLVALILMDIDHFKTINDDYGHIVGDEVLKSISTLLIENTRSFDSVARWGGEEFVILCPKTTIEDAVNLAEKIRLKIKRLNFPSEKKLKVSATFGIATIRAGEQFSKAFERADNAMYSGKNSGRDCCVRGQ